MRQIASRSMEVRQSAQPAIRELKEACVPRRSHCALKGSRKLLARDARLSIFAKNYVPLRRVTNYKFDTDFCATSE